MNEFFGNNIKATRIFIALYIILAIVLLVMIWWPKGNNEPVDFAYYKEYTQEEVAEKMADYYINSIFNKLIIGNENAIVNKVSENYLDYYDVKKEDVVEYLNNNNVFDINTTIGQVTVHTNDNEYIYSFDIINGSNKVKMNLIETFPYEYHITFGEFISYSTLGYTKKYDKFEIKVEGEFSSVDYIEYSLEIKNNGYNSLEFNLATVTDAYITYLNGSRLTLSNPIKYDDEVLTNGSSIRKTVKFELPINLQSQVDEIIFTNVVVNGEKKTFTIDI